MVNVSPFTILDIRKSRGGVVWGEGRVRKGEGMLGGRPGAGRQESWCPPPTGSPAWNSPV